MIQGLYETHIQVRNLDKAVRFYTEVLGLKFAHRDETRPIVFLWITGDKSCMLGLWEEDQQFASRHFAFKAAKEDILNFSTNYLKQRKLQPYNFLKNGSEEPMVFAWMPAVAIYFNDPDGNVLEFVCILEGEGKPELGVVSYDEWMKHQ